VWDGIIFIRDGYYKDARLKFKVFLKEFPLKQPSIFFDKNIYHPYINNKTG